MNVPKSLKPTFFPSDYKPAKALAVAPRQATQAIVAIIPHERDIIPQTKPPVAVPFCSGFFLAIAPRIMAMIPQIEPIQPIPAAPAPIEINKEMIPSTNDATPMIAPPFTIYLMHYGTKLLILFQKSYFSSPLKIDFIQTGNFIRPS